MGEVLKLDFFRGGLLLANAQGSLTGTSLSALAI
jgi:hypothetical protein